MLTKEPEMLQPDAFCERTMQQNATAGGAAYSAPQTQLVLRGKGGERKRKGERSREGGEGKGRLTPMRSWNRAANWLGPALFQGNQ